MKLMALISVAILAGLLGGCMPDRPAPVLVFDQGDIVQSVVSNQRGQVILIRCFDGMPSCSYDVRFADMSMTPYMHEYELKALK